MPNASTIIAVSQLTAWAESCLSVNHLNTLVQREIEAKSYARASELSERARKGAWALFNEMLACGAGPLAASVQSAISSVLFYIARPDPVAGVGGPQARRAG